MKRLILLPVAALLIGCSDVTQPEDPVAVGATLDEAASSGHVQMTELDELAGCAVNRINNRGQILAECPDASWNYYPVVWSEAQGMTELLDLGPDAGATDINNRGDVVGEMNLASGERHAYLWSAQHGVTDLGTLGGDISYASGINDSGDVVGTSTTAAGDYHAFLWTRQDGIVDLHPGDQFASSHARDINARKDIIGGAYSPASGGAALVWTNQGKITDLSTLGVYPINLGAINEPGQIVCEGGQGLAYLWSRQDGLVELGTLPGADPPREQMLGSINNRGQVVWTNNDNKGWRPFLWTAKDGVIDLLGSSPPLLDTFAYDINDRGQVIGEVFDWTSPGGTRPVMWTIR